MGIGCASQRCMACKNKVLIVEDNTEIRQLMALFLRRAGFDVAEAATGVAAIEQARATLPDLIIMDLGLPGMTGDEATEKLKADPSTKDIPVIVNTAFHDGTPIVERAIAAGAAEILHKPTTFKTLQATLCRYLPVATQETNFQADDLPKTSRPEQRSRTPLLPWVSARFRTL
jgi:two-component system cell cycle response regulator DivK